MKHIVIRISLFVLISLSSCHTNKEVVTAASDTTALVMSDTLATSSIVDIISTAISSSTTTIDGITIEYQDADSTAPSLAPVPRIIRIERITSSSNIEQSTHSHAVDSVSAASSVTASSAAQSATESKSERAGSRVFLLALIIGMLVAIALAKVFDKWRS
ncbi:MAG: hypothetical protein ACI31C_05115 [Muribaculaceae bacterium]